MKMSRHRSEEALTLTIAVLLVGVVAIGIIAGKLAKCSGADVRKRFLEVTPDYTAEGLRNWVMHYPSQARRYAFPVLFPLNLLFSTTLAGFLAVASIAHAKPCIGLGDGFGCSQSFLFSMVCAISSRTYYLHASCSGQRRSPMDPLRSHKRLRV